MDIRGVAMTRARLRRRRQPSASHVFIDTITITATLEEEEMEELIANLRHFDDCRQYRWHMGYTNNFQITLDYYTQDSLLILTNLRGDRCKFLCEFHPSAGNALNAQTWLDEVLPSGYYDLLSRGTITRLDLTTDILHRRPDELLCFVPRMQINRLYAGRGGLEEVESIYAGARRSTRSLVLYDRKKRVQSINRKRQLRLPVSKGFCTRLELRIKRAMSVDDLEQLSNPFADVEIYDLRKPNIQLSEVEEYFTDRCRLRGVNSAMNDFHQRRRRRWRQFLRTRYGPTWWNPDEIWQSWGDYIRVLFPHQDSLMGLRDLVDDS